MHVYVGEIPTTPTIAPGDCPGPDWVEYGGHCYTHSPRGVSSSHSFSQTKCRERAGPL